jgi:hypothetical protein
MTAVYTCNRCQRPVLNRDVVEQQTERVCDGFKVAAFVSVQYPGEVHLCSHCMASIIATGDMVGDPEPPPDTDNARGAS